MPAEGEFDRIRDGDVGLAESDAREQVERVGRADLGPRQARRLLRQLREGSGVAGVALHDDAPADEIGRRPRQLVLNAIDDVLVDPLVDRPETDATTRRPVATSPAAATCARFRATVASAAAGRTHPLQFEAHAEALRKSAGQLVFGAFGTSRALVVGEGTVSCHHLEHALRRGLARAFRACASRCPPGGRRRQIAGMPNRLRRCRQGGAAGADSGSIHVE